MRHCISQGVISGALLQITDALKLSAFEQELVVSATVATAAVGAAVSSLLASAAGRRGTVIASGVVFVAGAAVMALATNLWELVLGRAVIGLAIGVASMIAPLYLSEVAPPNLRGRLVTLNVLFCTGGQCIAGIVDGALASTHDGWRLMLGLSALPALLQLIGCFFLPESPRWLVAKGRIDEARSVLQRIKYSAAVHNATYEALKQEATQGSHGSTGALLPKPAGGDASDSDEAPSTPQTTVTQEIQAIQQQLLDAATQHSHSSEYTLRSLMGCPGKQQGGPEGRSDRASTANSDSSIDTAFLPSEHPLKIAHSLETGIEDHEVASSRAIGGGPSTAGGGQSQLKLALGRWAMSVGMGLQALQQLSGINIAMYYSGRVLQQAGFSSVTAIWLAAALAGVNSVCTLISMRVVDKRGRKPLLTASAVGVMVCLCVLGVLFWLQQSLSPTVHRSVLVSPTAWDSNGVPPASWKNASSLHPSLVLASGPDECSDLGITSCVQCTLRPQCGYFGDESWGVCRGVTQSEPGGKRLPMPAAAGLPSVTAGLAIDPKRRLQWWDARCPGQQMTQIGWGIFGGIVLQLVAYAPGLGSAAWVVCSEATPSALRSVGLSAAATTNWVVNLVVSLSFLSLLQALTPYGTFFMYAGIMAGGAVWIAWVVPETKGLSLEAVEAHLKGLLLKSGSCLARGVKRGQRVQRAR